MADEWYCEIAGREIGPLSPEQLRAMAVKGQIVSSDCVRQGSQGAWILARQVKGLLPPPSDSSSVAVEKSVSLPKVPSMPGGSISSKQEFAEGGLAKQKPLASQPLGIENLPVAERLPRASSVPPSPSPPTPPVAPPSVPDVFDPVALGIVDDPLPGKLDAQAHTTFLRSRERRRLERQKTVVGVLAAAVLALAVVGVLLAVGNGPSEPERNGSATPAKKAPPAKAAASPEVLEAREGIERLDSPRARPPKASLETPRRPVAPDFDHAQTTAAGDSSTAAQPRKPRRPTAGAPEADFGLPMVDQ